MARGAESLSERSGGESSSFSSNCLAIEDGKTNDFLMLLLLLMMLLMMMLLLLLLVMLLMLQSNLTAIFHSIVFCLSLGKLLPNCRQ